MTTQITTTTEIIEDEEITVWWLDKNNGTILINLNKALDEERVTACYWIDSQQTFLQIQYTDHVNGMEYWAILDSHGQLLRKGISSIDEIVATKGLFLLHITGAGLDNESDYYGIAYEDSKPAVINRYGAFVIPPEYTQIYYEEDEQTFYAKTSYSSEPIKFTLSEIR
jgi:hypothetical protein